MSFQDILKHFITINVCMHRDPDKAPRWIDERRVVDLSYGHVDEFGVITTMYKLHLDQPVQQLFVSVHQGDKRVVGAPHYIDIGVTVLRQVSCLDLSGVLHDCNFMSTIPVQVDSTGTAADFEYMGGTGVSPERQMQVLTHTHS